jgi:hypothetical protein
MKKIYSYYLKKRWETDPTKSRSRTYLEALVRAIKPTSNFTRKEDFKKAFTIILIDIL